MSNLVEWILREADNEEIVGVVIDEKCSYYDSMDDKLPEDMRGKLMSWNDAKPFLDYDFDSGYGIAGCHPIFVWTTNWVIAVSQYDGSTCSYSIPRNPRAIVPHMVGGG